MLYQQESQAISITPKDTPPPGNWQQLHTPQIGNIALNKIYTTAAPTKRPVNATSLADQNESNPKRVWYYSLWFYQTFCKC